MVSPPAIVILGASGLPLARRIKTALGGEIHGPQSTQGADIGYAQAARELQTLFKSGQPIIGVCASGILIRALAPFLDDKRREPPVIAVAEDGSAVVPLLGGHHGANDLAHEIADITGGHPAITTASDLRFGFGIDEPPKGYVLANPEHAKEFACRLLAGDAVSINGHAPWLSLASTADASLGIRITHEAVQGSAQQLVYHPQTISVGLGCERGTSTEEVIGLIERVLRVHGIARQSIALLASIDLKSDEPAIHAAAEHFGVPARFFPPSRLNALSDRLMSPSPIVMAEVGTPGVAEGAALAAAGKDGTLLVPKTKSERATCALALAANPIDAQTVGAARGKLFVVGIGPGSRDLRSEQAQYALKEADDWVGYGLYLDLISDIKTSQSEHRFPLGAEEERVRHAISLAQEGRQVALVSSGDPGIYAMAALVYEILNREPQRTAVEVIPGISAFQAAAARAGAFIGHDFCCISLSDLLTPWKLIEKRIKAAAEGDFVVALYNPRSEKRANHLDRAIDILKQHRPRETPAVIASNLGRDGEHTRILPLCEFTSSSVDMLTIVIVGSSQSRSFRRGDGVTYAYTPRGYSAKRKVLA